MGRIRAIHPRAPQDEDVASMPMAHRYLWAYLPCYADREGRLEDRPMMLKGEVFPGDDVNVAQMLDDFAERGFIIRYSADGKKLIQIVSFHDYQRPDRKEKRSVLSPPDGWEDGKGTGKVQGESEESAGSYPVKSAPVIRISGNPVDLSPRDPSATATRPVVRRPNGYDLLQWFGIARAAAFPECLDWVTPRNCDGDADTFAAKLPDDSFADVRPTMTAFFVHVKAGDAGWNTPKNSTDPSFAFGAWKSGFTALREELHGRVPKVAAKETRRQSPQAEAVYWPKA